MAKNNSPELDAAIEIAKAAGKETLQWFRNADLAIDSKQDGSPVTAADKAAEELATKLLGKEFPTDSIWGEEFGKTQGSSELTWAIDPIDGTRSFVSGVPTYSTLLARGNPELNEWDLGVVYIPALDELLYAQKGSGCWFIDGAGKRTQAKVSQTKELSQAKIVASGADYVPPNIIQSADIFRTWGDGYGYLLLATGQVDAMLDIDLAIWDYAPMQTIIPEAGGEILDWQDAPTPDIPKSTSNKLNQVSTNKSLTSDLQNYIQLGAS